MSLSVHKCSRKADSLLQIYLRSIRRTAFSLIPAESTVLVDYISNAGTVEDSAIDDIIDSVTDQIVRILREGYDENSTEQGLKTGATLLACSQVALSIASYALMNATTEAAARATQWRQLSESWSAAAFVALSEFIKPNYLRPPAVQAGSPSIFKNMAR